MVIVGYIDHSSARQDRSNCLNNAREILALSISLDSSREALLVYNHLMASSKDYLEFILDQLSGLDDITYRAMMGEYILYYRGKVFGGIYDDRLLVKPVNAASAMMPDADMELPYEGAKEMILVDNVDDRRFLTELVEAMYPELPHPKVKKK